MDGHGDARSHGIREGGSLERVAGVRSADGQQHDVAAHGLVVGVLVRVAGDIVARGVAVEREHVAEPAVCLRVHAEALGLHVVGGYGLHDEPGQLELLAGAHEVRGGRGEPCDLGLHARWRHEHGLLAGHARVVLGREVVVVGVRDEHIGGVVGGFALREAKGVEVGDRSARPLDADGALREHADVPKAAHGASLSRWDTQILRQGAPRAPPLR